MIGISVVIPTCGRPDSLAAALESVYAQGELPREIIVVDDGGAAHADATRAVVNRVRGPAARLVANHRAKGASGARNTGAEQAHGELLAFLDDDDEWLPSYLNEVLRCFAGDTDVVCTDLVYRYDDGHERSGKSAPDAPLSASAFLVRNPGLIGSNLVIRRSLYQQLGGFDESLPTYEDVDFGLRLSLRRDVRYAPLRQRLVRHYQHTRERLCMRLGDPMRTGVRRFFELHGHRMSAAERERFGRIARELWGVDEYGRVVPLSGAASRQAAADA
jgi:GT2 family glycosyltransferase